MNKLEFVKTLKYFDINNPLSITIGKGNTQEEVYYWNNFAIYFSGSYYTVINGKIPLEVAEKIYNKYPKNEYKIRVAGGSADWIPEKYAIDEIFSKEKEKISWKTLDELKIKINDLTNELQQRPKKNKYLKTYHIDTLEGLIIVLKELQEYYNGHKEIETEKDIISKIYEEILYAINPFIKNEEWLKNQYYSYLLYKETRFNNSKNTYGKMFLEALDDFDNAVNPFLNQEIELDSIKNYIGKVKITGDKYKSKDNIYCPNSCELVIEDKNTGNKVKYNRSSIGFSYQLEYTIEDNNHIIITHDFTNNTFEKKCGESLSISRYGSNCPNPMKMTLNITENSLCSKYKKSKQKKDKEIEAYLDLLTGINMAKLVTVRNMIKNSQNNDIKKVLKKTFDNKNII